MSGAPKEITSTEANALDGGARFDAVLHPHASLSPRGFVMFMGLLCLVSFIAGVAFMLAGAWPVLGFLGLDVLIVYLAFRASYRNARRYERLLLTAETLTVERVSPAGARRTWKFQPYWLAVVLDDARGPESRLMLRSHGKALEIGRFLTPGEKREVAEALRKELRRLREPAPQEAEAEAEMDGTVRA
jgi:uncharacterized membrane protein